MQLTQLDFDVMSALARYRFLTVDVILQAGICSDRAHLGERLRYLLKSGLLDNAPVSVEPGRGRIAAFWWLSKRGGEIVSDELGKAVKTPLARTVLPMHRKHREGVVQCAIALDALAARLGGHIDGFSFEFEKVGHTGADKFERATTLPVGEAVLVPDALAAVTLPDGKARPVVIEFENGSNAADSRNFLKKLEAYGKALSAQERAIQRKMNLEAAPRVLVVCADAALLKSILTHWPDKSMPQKWSPFFLQTLDALKANPLTDWHRIGAPDAPLFKAV